MLLRIIFLAAPWVLAAAHEAPAALLPVLQRIAKVQPQVFTTFVEVVHGLDRLKHDAKGAEKVEKLLSLHSLPNLDGAAQALAPLLAKVDPVAARALENRNKSFLQQAEDPVDPVVMEERLMKLKPLLIHLKSLDSKRFGGLAGVIGEAQTSADTAIMK